MALLRAFIVFTVTLFYFLWRRSKYYKDKELPPGPIRWPLIGSIPQLMMVDKKYPYKQFTKLSERYGDIMSIGLGVHYAVVISNIDIMKDLLKRPEFFMERFLMQFVYQRSENPNLGIVFASGESWAEIRRFTMKKLRDFGFGKAAFIEETMQDEMRSLMQHIRDKSESDCVWKVDNSRISMISINVLWTSVAGYRFDTSTDFLRRHIEMNSKVFEAMKPSNLLQVLPFLKIFPEWSGYNRNGEIFKAGWNLMRDQVADAKLKRQGRMAGDTESFVDSFLDEIEKNRGNPDTLFTEDQLAVVLLDLFLAATDTTSSTISWLTQYFAVFPKIQNRARADIMKMSENGTKSIPVSARNKMPYVVACIYEVMRHAPFGSLPPTRQTSCDVVYENYIIPKGTCILYNLYPGFHDTKYWGDPEEVRPERFLDPTGTTLNQEKVDRVATQFGFGKRTCPGESMAMDTIFCYIVTLLSTFSVEVKAGMEPTLKPGTPAIAMAPADYVAKFVPLTH